MRLVTSLNREYPAEYPAQTKWTVRLVPLSETVVGSVSPISHSAVRRQSRLVPADQLRQRRHLLLARASVRGS